MKVKGLDGRVHNWDLRGHVPDGSDDRPRSTLHLRARLLLATLFPLDIRSEEVELPGTHGLRADFVLPSRRMIVEANGPQHYEEVGFFHEHRTDFWRGQSRDRNKLDWCLLNGWRYVELPHNRSDAEWAEIILGDD